MKIRIRISLDTINENIDLAALKAQVEQSINLPINPDLDTITGNHVTRVTRINEAKPAATAAAAVE